MDIQILKEKHYHGNSIVHILKDKDHLSDFTIDEEAKGYIFNKLIKEDKPIVKVNNYGKWDIYIFEEAKRGDVHARNEALRKHGSDIAGLLRDEKLPDIGIAGDSSGAEPLVEGLMLGSYQFLKYRSDKEEKATKLRKIILLEGVADKLDVNALQHTARAVYHARNLVNEPLSHLNAKELSDRFAEMGEEAGFSVQVFGKEKISRLKMGGLLAVNRGSVDPPTFSILEWKPQNPINEKPLILVGKGIVYDTGGLSLKPTPDSMDHMKSDMAGGATVAGALYAAAATGMRLHVIALVPATDNRPAGNAYAPGDIITMHDGKTVEVLNTDAEGRLLLADALSYAKKYDPELVIDVATLTGSAAMAVGKYGIVAMGNASDKTMQDMEDAGEIACERIARFPFWDDYGDELKSDIADLKNIGGKEAGAITAGKFLENFTDYPWVHLDIAAPSFLSREDSYRGRGGTGAGVRLLVEFFKKYNN